MMTFGFWQWLFRAACLPLYFDSPSPPPPDPRIGQAAEANAQLGQQALDFQKQVYEEGKPRQTQLDSLVNQVVQNMIGTQTQSNAAADDYLNYMRTTFRPLEQSLAQQATEFNTEARREELAAQAGADVEQAAAASDAAARREAAAYGVNPSDAAFADNLAGSAINKTIAKVGAMNQARVQARNEGRAFMFDVAGLGRNLPGAGATAASVATQAGGSAVNAATVPGSNARADASLVNAGYGAAMTGQQAAGNLYSGLYGQQLNAWNAQQQAGATGMAGLGSLAGTLGAAYILAPSSKELKHDKKPVAARGVLAKIKKLPVDEWTYNEGAGDGGRHMGPYAEDVHREFGDIAAPKGKMIDLISMNGIALAGVKALAKEVDALKRSTAHA